MRPAGRCRDSAWAGSQLKAYGQSLLEVEVRAFKEEDIIIGSNETSAAYSEYLRGYGHADIISSGAGNDIVGGGWGADVLHSGDGVDVLYSGKDGVVDELTGGSGFNWLCSSNPMDKLIGVDPPRRHPGRCDVRVVWRDQQLQRRQ